MMLITGNVISLSHEEIVLIHKALITHENSIKSKDDPRRDKFNSQLQDTQTLNSEVFEILLNK